MLQIGFLSSTIYFNLDKWCSNTYIIRHIQRFSKLKIKKLEKFMASPKFLPLFLFLVFFSQFAIHECKYIPFKYYPQESQDLKINVIYYAKVLNIIFPFIYVYIYIYVYVYIYIYIYIYNVLKT